MADERRDYAILVSLAMREEAEVMAAALRAEGIDAFVGNAHHANVDWGWTLALGGMQVLVPRAKLAEAKETIRARIAEAAETPDPEAEPAKRRDHWKVWAVITGCFGLWFFGIGMATSSTFDEDLQMRAFYAQVAELQRKQAELGRLHCSQNERAFVWPGEKEVRCVEMLQDVPVVPKELPSALRERQ